MWSGATFTTLVARFIEIIDVLIYVLFALTLVVMLWKIIDAWIIHAGDQYKRDEGKKTILIGFIVLIVMVSVWGIVALLKTAIE